MEYLKVKSWNEFQHYKDREPKWIKVYRHILNDYKYEQLNDQEFGQLVKIWLLASQTENQIPNDPVWIQRKTSMTKKPNINRLLQLSFLELEGSVQNCTDLYRTVHREDKIREEYIHHFEKFWNLYLRKVGKDAALKAFKKLTESEMTLAIEKIPLHAASWKKRDKEHIPHASTWLNGRRWEDEIQTPYEDQGRVYKAASEVFKDLNL